MSKVHVKVFGQGRDLALIHGWGLGSAAWEPVVDRLAQRCRVHLVDLPGYACNDNSDNELSCPPAESRWLQGSTEARAGDRPAEPLSGQTPCRTNTGAACRAAFSTQDDFQEHARHLISSLPAGVTLCGWSLGGLLALQAALLAPEHIGQLILVGATPCFTQHANWSAGQAPALLDTFQAALAENPRSTLQRFIALLNQGDSRARANGRTLLDSLANQPLPSSAALSSGLAFLREIDLRQQVRAVQTPTLLVHGERDPLMPLAAAQWLAEQLPKLKSRLEVFTGAAHAPFLNDPERFATLLGDFCNAAASR